MASLPSTTTTSIREFYAGRSVFITGATGFMGKVLVEKLLRSCPEITCIYLLVRSKKGVDPKARINSLLDCKLFHQLSVQQPNYRDKVVPIVGDILDEGLGISEEDVRMLIEHVSIVFHSAATVRFDEQLKLAVQMNMVGVQRMLQLARQLTQLVAFVHVSTAYANCTRTWIEEKIYPTELSSKKLIDSVEWMSDDALDSIAPTICGTHPNTYTFTKAQAECMIEEDVGYLPITIVRPSIVGATWADPFPGWVDNFNGPTGMLAAMGKGILRMMKVHGNCAADIIPVDTACNLFIAAAWNRGLQTLNDSKFVQRSDDIIVYNCTTGGLNTLYWRQAELDHNNFATPLDSVTRVPKVIFTSSRLRLTINKYFDHFLPAWFMDVAARAVGSKPIYMRLQERLWKSAGVLEYFTTHEWTWTNDNVSTLVNKLSPEDKKEFDFDVRNIEWTKYLDNYLVGIKKYALKESMEDLPVATAKRNIVWLQRRDQLMKYATAGLCFVVLQTQSLAFNSMTSAAIQHVSTLSQYFQDMATM